MAIYALQKFGPVIEQHNDVINDLQHNVTIRQFGDDKAIQASVQHPSGKIVKYESTPLYDAQITKDRDFMHTYVVDKNNNILAEDHHISYKPKNKLRAFFRMLTGQLEIDDIPYSSSERYRRNEDGSMSRFSISPNGKRTLERVDKNGVKTVMERSLFSIQLRKLWRIL